MKIFSLLIPLLLMTAANGCKKPVEPVVEPDKPVVEPDKPIPPESTVLNVELRTSTASQMTCEYNAGSNEYLIKTSGTDPYVFAKALSKPLPDSLCIFSFSYTSSLEVDDFQLYYCEPLSEDRSGHFGVMAKTTNYREMSCNLIADRQCFIHASSVNRYSERSTIFDALPGRSSAPNAYGSACSARQPLCP